MPLHQQSRVKGETHRPTARNSHRWSTWLMVLGIFLALVSFYTVAWWTLISPLALLRALVLVGVTGPALGLLWPKVRMGIEHLEWLFFNLLAVGPIIVSALLWLNYGFHGEVFHTDHPILEIDGSAVRTNSRGEAVIRSRSTLDFRLADGFLAEYPFALKTWRDLVHSYGDTLRVGLARGALGAEVVVDKEMH